MLGKRQRAMMRRTSSVSLIGSGSVNGDSSPLPEHPKEKQKSSNCPSPSRAGASAVPRQVIGFQPKVYIDEELDLSAHQHQPSHSQAKSPGSSGSSPRSGLGDLLAGSRPWERKDEGVGLGIVAALSSSQEEVNRGRDESRGYTVPVGGYGRKTSPPRSAVAPHHLSSFFPSSRASPPIVIHHPTSNSGYHCASAHCTHQNCGFAFGLPSGRPESMVTEGSNSHQHHQHRGGGSSRPNSNVIWSSRPPNNSNNANNGGVSLLSWGQQQADMEVDKGEMVSTSPLLGRHHGIPAAPSSANFTPNFLDACHLCRRRLGEGRDIYIYRGDRAFCSPECRHQQILNDERPEKCSSAVMKMGGAEARNTTQRNRVMAAGTAAAA